MVFNDPDGFHGYQPVLNTLTEEVQDAVDPFLCIDNFNDHWQVLRQAKHFRCMEPAELTSRVPTGKRLPLSLWASPDAAYLVSVPRAPPVIKNKSLIIRSQSQSSQM